MKYKADFSVIAYSHVPFCYILIATVIMMTKQFRIAGQSSLQKHFTGRKENRPIKKNDFYENVLKFKRERMILQQTYLYAFVLSIDPRS